MRALAALFVREWRVARRIGGGASVGAVFFLILVAIMPFALGPDLRLLARLGPAILWIAALLSTLLGLDRLFQADAEDGSLDLLVHANLPLEAVVLVKCAAHWTTSTLPLVVAAPLFGLMLAMDGPALGLTALTLLAGTPALTMIGAIGAALTASLRRGGLLMAVLVLPLSIPVLIFGVAAASAASGGLVPFATPFAVLAAISLFSIAAAPFAAAARDPAGAGMMRLWRRLGDARLLRNRRHLERHQIPLQLPQRDIFAGAERMVGEAEAVFLVLQRFAQFERPTGAAAAAGAVDEQAAHLRLIGPEAAHETFAAMRLPRLPIDLALLRQRRDERVAVADRALGMGLGAGGVQGDRLQLAHAPTFLPPEPRRIEPAQAQPGGGRSTRVTWPILRPGRASSLP